jgi:hypothetical protein
MGRRAAPKRAAFRHGNLSEALLEAALRHIETRDLPVFSGQGNAAGRRRGEMLEAIHRKVETSHRQHAARRADAGGSRHCDVPIRARQSEPLPVRDGRLSRPRGQVSETRGRDHGDVANLCDRLCRHRHGAGSRGLACRRVHRDAAGHRLADPASATSACACTGQPMDDGGLRDAREGFQIDRLGKPRPDSGCASNPFEAGLTSVLRRSCAPQQMKK